MATRANSVVPGLGVWKLAQFFGIILTVVLLAGLLRALALAGWAPTTIRVVAFSPLAAWFWRARGTLRTAKTGPADDAGQWASGLESHQCFGNNEWFGLSISCCKRCQT
jgi:hypothetical protein